MKHALALAVLLISTWFLWSGHFDPLLVGLGLGSCALVLAIALRMEIVDEESVPIDVVPRMLLYLPWLVWQIVIANLDVARRILDPRLPIAPQVIRVRAGQPGTLGHVLYANSITLTPGTVSLRLDAGEIEVHALTAESARDVERGEMDRRVSRVVGAA